MWIDTHCHLDAPEFGDQAAEIAAEAGRRGVGQIVVPAIAKENFELVAALAHNNRNCSYALGIHPLFVPTAEESDLTLLRAMVEQAMDDPRFIGIGEIGLDFFIPGMNEGEKRQKQERFYQEQLKLAREFSLPVLLHVRRSQDIILKYLRRMPDLIGVAHAFNGSFQQAEEFLRLGFKLGMGGAMTFPRALQIRRLAQQLPLSSFVLETDSPDISPIWRHSDRNRPVEISGIGAALAELRGVPVEQIEKAVFDNTLQRLPRLAKLL